MAKATWSLLLAALLGLAVLFVIGVTGAFQGSVPRDPSLAVASVWIGDDRCIATSFDQCIATSFLISPDGYLLTNKHVYDVAIKRALEQGRKVVVHLSDRACYPVELEGVLPAGSFEWMSAEQDLALLKIQAPVHDLPYLMLGNSDPSQVAESQVKVIGFPDPATRGCANPVETIGRVARPRYIADQGDPTAYVTVALAGEKIKVFIGNTIELAAAAGPGDPLAAPGNSGSPVLICQGDDCRVAGVLAAGRRGESSVGTWQIYGYAAPINVAIDNLIPREILPPHPPEILGISYPQEAEADRPYIIRVSYRDINGNLAKAKLKALEPRDLKGFPQEIDLREEDGTKGEIKFEVSFDLEESREVKLKVILIDKAGERTEESFSLKVIKPIEPWGRIQDAINLAKDGDVILIPVGLHLENLVIADKKLTLRGEGEGAYIGIANDKPAIHIEDAEVTLENLNIVSSKEIGILIEDSRVTMTGVVVTGTGSEYNGAAILIRGGSVEIKDSTVSNNKGDGIRIEVPSQLTVINSNASNNGDDGIAGAAGEIVMTIKDSTISNNRGDGIIGGWSGSSLTVEGNTVANNGNCGIIAEAEVQGSGNRLIGNPICGSVPPEVRIPLTPETDRTEIRVPEDYSTIQEAIDAVKEGGTIVVTPGTYRENISIYKSLTLRGEDRSRVILDGMERLAISVSSNAKRVVLERLSIQNGKTGVFVLTGDRDTTVFVNDVNITNNRNCGILIDGLSFQKRGPKGNPLVTVARSKIANTMKGDGIYLSWYATAEIKDNEIVSNYGWGITVLAQECVDYELPSWVQFKGWVRGEGNKMWGNGKGDLCPHPALPQTLKGP